MIPEIGALSQWQAELASGVRTRFTFDPLFRAACAEMNARESRWSPVLMYAYRRQAVAIILEAAAEKRVAV